MPWAAWAHTAEGRFAGLPWRLAALERALDAVTQAVTISVVEPSASGDVSTYRAIFLNRSAEEASQHCARHGNLPVAAGAAAASSSCRRASDDEDNADVHHGKASADASSTGEAAAFECSLTTCPLARASSQMLISDQLYSVNDSESSLGGLMRPESQSAHAGSAEAATAAVDAVDELSLAVGTPPRSPAATPAVPSAAGSGSAAEPHCSAEQMVRICISESVSPLHNPCAQTLLDPLRVSVSLPNGDLEWVSSTMTAATGVRLDRLSGRGWAGSVHPDDLLKTAKAWETALATGTFPDIEFRIDRSSLSSEATQLPVIPGGTTGSSGGGGTTEGMTDAEADEKGLKGGFGSDSDTADAPVVITGRSSGASLSGLQVDRDASRHHGSGTDMALRTGVDSGRDSEHGVDASPWCWYSASCKAVRDYRTGKILRWIATLTDVHEKRVLEQKLEAEKALFMTAMDQLPVSVIVVDAPSGAVRLANKQTAGVWRQEMLSDNLIDYSRFVAFHPDGRPYGITDWPLARSILHGEIVTKEDTTVVRGDGTRGIVRLSSAPVRNAAGDVMAAVVCCDDVTDALEAQAAKTRVSAAEQAAEQMSQLVSNVSHELRTPLHGVLGMAELLAGSTLSKEHREYVETILGSGRLLLAVIGDLLDHQKMRTGKLTLEALPFSLKAITDEAVSLLVHGARHKGITLETSIQSDLPEDWCLVGDAKRLKQLLFNLLNNALRFTPAGGRIRLSCSTEVVTSLSGSVGDGEYAGQHSRDDSALGSAVVSEGPAAPTGAVGPAHASAVVASDLSLSLPETVQRLVRQWPHGPVHYTRVHFAVIVCDSGIGMDTETLLRIFQPWTQADSSNTRTYGGTGLGLAICRELLTLMGGTITAESEGLGKGSTFRIDVTLPVVSRPAGLPEVTTAGADPRLLSIRASRGPEDAASSSVSAQQNSESPTASASGNEPLQAPCVADEVSSAAVGPMSQALRPWAILADWESTKAALPAASGTSATLSQPAAGINAAAAAALPGTELPSTSFAVPTESEPNRTLARPFSESGGSESAWALGHRGAGVGAESSIRHITAAELRPSRPDSSSAVDACSWNQLQPELPSSSRTIPAHFLPGLRRVEPHYRPEAGLQRAATRLSGTSAIPKSQILLSRSQPVVDNDDGALHASAHDEQVTSQSEAASALGERVAPMQPHGTAASDSAAAQAAVGTGRSQPGPRRHSTPHDAGDWFKPLPASAASTYLVDYADSGITSASLGSMKSMTAGGQHGQQRKIEAARILLVEDTAVNALLVKRMLRSGGITDVTHVENGELAVAAVRDDEPYDVVLMDCQMPVLDGYEATRRIRALPDTLRSQVPIIALTASALESDVLHSREVGMNEHLSKPHTPAALLDAVRKWAAASLSRSLPPRHGDARSATGSLRSAQSTP